MGDSKAQQSPGPVEAVFLGLDPAKHTSGAALLIPDYGNPTLGEKEHAFEGHYALEEFGKVESQEERERFVQAGLDCSIELGLPLIIVAEEWDPPRLRKTRLGPERFALIMDPKWTYKTVLGIGEGWGLWSAEIHSANVSLVDDKLPPIIVERVTPNTWRDGLWGPQRAKHTEGAKSQAKNFFEAVFGYAASDDISEAGCIALWGTTSTEVAELAEKWHEEARRKRVASKKKKKVKRKR